MPKGLEKQQNALHAAIRRTQGTRVAAEYRAELRRSAGIIRAAQKLAEHTNAYMKPENIDCGKAFESELYGTTAGCGF